MQMTHKSIELETIIQLNFFSVNWRLNRNNRVWSQEREIKCSDANTRSQTKISWSGSRLIPGWRQLWSPGLVSFCTIYSISSRIFYTFQPKSPKQKRLLPKKKLTGCIKLAKMRWEHWKPEYYLLTGRLHQLAPSGRWRRSRSFPGSCRWSKCLLGHWMTSRGHRRASWWWWSHWRRWWSQRNSPLHRWPAASHFYLCQNSVQHYPYPCRWRSILSVEEPEEP